MRSPAPNSRCWDGGMMVIVISQPLFLPMCESQGQTLCGFVPWCEKHLSFLSSCLQRGFWECDWFQSFVVGWLAPHLNMTHPCGRSCFYMSSNPLPMNWNSCSLSCWLETILLKLSNTSNTSSWSSGNMFLTNWGLLSPTVYAFCLLLFCDQLSDYGDRPLLRSGACCFWSSPGLDLRCVTHSLCLTKSTKWNNTRD